MKRLKKVTTTENWFSTPDCGEVSVSIHKIKGSGSNQWRVSVWGDDDFGLEKDDMDIIEAFKVFRGIQNGVLQKDLKTNGFVVA